MWNTNGPITIVKDFGMYRPWDRTHSHPDMGERSTRAKSEVVPMGAVRNVKAKNGKMIIIW